MMKILMNFINNKYYNTNRFVINQLFKFYPTNLNKQIITQHENIQKLFY